jgi:hypothetical protein
MKKVKKKVNGENILYHFIQKNILSTEELSPFQKELVEHFIIDLGIWIHPKLFKKIPVLLPYVVRDSSCRIKKVTTGKDEWGMANEQGFLRDDNSLIKGLFNSCPIISTEISEYNNNFLGPGFVASHIWRELYGINKLSATFHLTNSFIPNLVWLPKQISKLTDRESSYAQRLLQTISHKIYRELNNDAYTLKIWEYLPNPNVESRFDITKLNFFEISDTWLNKKTTLLNKELDLIIERLNNQITELKKVKCSSYLLSLNERIDKLNIDKLNKWLLENKERINN